jgi:hypothetical protein
VPVKQPKTVLKWQSAARPFKRRNREVFLTAGAIVGLISVILFFVREFLLTAVVLSLYFVFWVLNTVAPEKASHEINSQGVATGGKLYKWDDLNRFWFTEQWGNKILNVETKKRFPGVLLMLLGPSQEEVKKVLKKHLTVEKPEKTWLNGAADWLQKKVPLEKE